MRACHVNAKTIQAILGQLIKKSKELINSAKHDRIN